MFAVAKSLVRSRVGWALAITELAVIVYWFQRGLATSSLPLANDDVYTGRFIGGRYVELNSTLSGVLVLLNVIPVAIAQLLSKAVFLLVPSLTVSALSWAHAFELLLLTTVQWLVIGYFIERMIVLARMREA